MPGSGGVQIGLPWRLTCSGPSASDWNSWPTCTPSVTNVVPTATGLPSCIHTKRASVSAACPMVFVHRMSGWLAHRQPFVVQPHFEAGCDFGEDRQRLFGAGDWAAGCATALPRSAQSRRNQDGDNKTNHADRVFAAALFARPRAVPRRSRVVSPDGAKFSSPGQRPGSRIPQTRLCSEKGEIPARTNRISHPGIRRHEIRDADRSGNRESCLETFGTSPSSFRHRHDGMSGSQVRAGPDPDHTPKERGGGELNCQIGNARCCCWQHRQHGRSAAADGR